MMALFDSHCHVDEPKFDDDREDVLTRMAEAGVTRYAVIGSDMATSRHSADFAAAHPGCYAAIGIHPHEAKGFVRMICSAWRTGRRKRKSSPLAKSGWITTMTCRHAKRR